MADEWSMPLPMGREWQSMNGDHTGRVIVSYQSFNVADSRRIKLSDKAVLDSWPMG